MKVWKILALTGVTGLVAGIGLSPWPVGGGLSILLLALLGAMVFRHRLTQRIAECSAQHQQAIHKHREAEAQLRLASTVFANTREAVIITDTTSRILQVNDAYCRITGYSREELLGGNPRMVKSGRHDPAFYRQMWNTIREEGSWSGEMWDRRKNGEIYPKWLSITAVKDEHGAVTHYVGMFSDITTLKETEQALERLAYRDALTGLPNRLLFRERLDHNLAATHHRDGCMALMFIDLDRFKYVNDTLGHVAGDELLVTVAERLNACVGENDTVSRLGGDEFTVILADIGSVDASAALAQRIISRLSEPVLLQGHEVYVGASIGISLYPEDAGDGESLLKHADTAMYHAKEAGRGMYRFFTAAMNVRSRDRLALEAALRRALERNEFVVFYQPQACLADNQPVGAEALLRWHHPERGWISPLDFIPLAEETGLIMPIGEWVLREVCRQLQVWAQQGRPPLRVAVNLSAHQFRHEKLTTFIEALLQEYHVPAAVLELEITESTVMENAAQAAEILQQLRNKGLRVAIDDFGTGYSSLAYLKSFPLDKLKIDRSFVKDLPEDSNDAAIATAIISMAQSLGLKVVAEGLETETQRDFLHARGCDYLQGYWYGRPMPAEAFAAFIDRCRYKL